MTPYEGFFFSSGAVEEHWTAKDMGTSRLNVLVGFLLGGLLSIAIAAGGKLLLGGVSAIALPLTYLPILVVAKDSEYMGGKTNVFGSAYLVMILAASLAAILLMPSVAADCSTPACTRCAGN